VFLTLVLYLSLHVLQHIPNFIVGIHTMGNRIVVSDIQESFHFVRYRRQENQLIVFADDTTPRWITCSCMLDYNTVAGADKFGNVAIVSADIATEQWLCRWSVSGCPLQAVCVQMLGSHFTKIKSS